MRDDDNSDPGAELLNLKKIPNLFQNIQESEEIILKSGKTKENVRIGPDINTFDGGVYQGLPVEETHELYSYPKTGKSVDEWLTGDVRVILGVSPLYLNLRCDKCF